MEFRRVCVFWEGEAFKCSDQQLMNLHSTPIAGREGTPDAKEEEDEVYGGKAAAEMKKGSRGEHIEKKKESTRVLSSFAPPHPCLKLHRLHAENKQKKKR
jgi:hypothetical protein